MIKDDQRQAHGTDAKTDPTTDKQSAAAGRVVGSGVDRRRDCPAERITVAHGALLIEQAGCGSELVVMDAETFAAWVADRWNGQIVEEMQREVR